MSSTGQWAVWSRRPSDPTIAPAIIFSLSAKPPPHIVRDALDLPTPPPSPPPLLPDDTDTTTPTETDTHDHSPLSSNTSVDLTEPPKDETKQNDLEPIPIPPPPPPPPPTAAPTAAPPKKLWSSLLQPAATTSSSSASPKRNGLPTSTVVGFSIPAAPSPAPSSPSPAPSTLPYTKNQRTELLLLLTSVPGIPSTSIVADIRPRGLINAGNMCFANSVLQVLVYTPPFHRLFSALGKAGVRFRDHKENQQHQQQQRDTAPLLPLVEATAEFIRTFSVEESSSGVNGRGRSGGYGYAFARGRGSGKGKEKEKEKEREREASAGWEEWGADSFLPNYIFDAMKENKRFDTMRSGQQEDAEEFLGFYLDTLEEELLALHQALSPTPEPDVSKHKDGGQSGAVEETVERAEEDDGWLEVGKRNRMVVTRTIKGAESPMTRIFGGKFRSTLRAAQQKDSVIVEDWRALRLDIQHDSIHTIQDAIAHISSPQPIQLSNPTRPGSQQVLIEALPVVLVVHLKRFCFLAEATGNSENPATTNGFTQVKGVVKVSKQVQYGRELIVGPDVLAPGIRKPQGVKYKLFGVVYHHGHSASGGHYTLDVLHPNRFPGTTSASASPSSSSPHSTSKHLPQPQPSTPTHAKVAVGSTVPSSPPKTKQKDEEQWEEEVDPREGWIRIDDELVSDVRPEDVLNYGGSEEGRCAYLLFYRKVGAR